VQELQIDIARQRLHLLDVLAGRGHHQGDGSSPRIPHQFETTHGIASFDFIEPGIHGLQNRCAKTPRRPRFDAAMDIYDELTGARQIGHGVSVQKRQINHRRLQGRWIGTGL